MRWKYIKKEIFCNPIMTTLIAFQTMVIFVVLISMISVIVSRYDKYSELSEFIEQPGLRMNFVYLMDRNNGNLNFDDNKQVEECLSNVEVNGCYTVGNLVEDSIGIAYDTKLWECHTPAMEKGRWFEKSDEKSEVIEVVIAQKAGVNGKYEVGDYIQPEKEYLEAYEGVKDHPMKLQVIGIIKEGASILGAHETTAVHKDYRSCFWNYSSNYEEKIYFFYTHEDVYQYNHKNNCGWLQTNGGLTFINWKEQISSSEITDNEVYLMENGVSLERTDLEGVQRYSVQYIYEQVKTLLPILTGLILLTLISAISNTAIILRQNARTYAIYYIHGLSWKQCMGIHIGGIAFVEGMVLLITLIGIMIAKFSGVFNSTVISIGVYQLLGCILLVGIFILFGKNVCYQQLGKKTAKDVLREAK